MEHVSGRVRHGLGFLQCQAVKAASPTVANMYSTTRDSITIPVHTYMWHKKAKISALLDSGATENFIDKRTILTLGLGMRALPEPLNIHNVDGTTNSEGRVTKYADLWARQGKQTAKLRFYVTNIGCDRLILGHPWFRQFNPCIDWTKNMLKGEDICLETAGYQSKKRFQARRAPVTPTTIDPAIPKYYHRHAIVFDEKAAQRFPPSREEDHPITLKPDTLPSIDCKVYVQTKDEAEATKEFIEDHLKKGYIVESNSPYASPFFYRRRRMENSTPSWTTGS